VSRWLFDFVAGNGDEDGDGDALPIAGFVRLELRADEQIAWFWAYLVGVPDVDGVLVVRDHEVLLPRQGLEIRADGLWAELTCETRAEHWTFGLESFGVRLDRASDALRPGGEIGDRMAVGLDLEWEVGAGGPPQGSVHGEVLVGRARHEIDGRGWFYDDGAVDPGPVEGAAAATVFIPVGPAPLRPAPAGDAPVERRLVRTGAGLRWSFEPGPKAR
jgi:hypothetical protein